MKNIKVSEIKSTFLAHTNVHRSHPKPMYYHLETWVDPPILKIMFEVRKSHVTKLVKRKFS